MGKQLVYKGRPVVRDAMRILNRSTRFIILAEDEQGQLHLNCSGYPHESLVAQELMKVAVGLMKKHRQETDAMVLRMAAGEPALPDSGTSESEPAADEGREVGYSGLVLPAAEVAPEKFGGAE